MIDKYTNLLERKYGKLIFGDFTTIDSGKELCYACEHFYECGDAGYEYDGCSWWGCIPKGELINRIMICEHQLSIHQDSETESILQKLYKIGNDKYNLDLYDLYLVKEDFTICGSCDGSGHYITPSSVRKCEHCNGTGFIKRDNSNRHIAGMVNGKICVETNPDITTITGAKFTNELFEPFYINEKYLFYTDETYTHIVESGIPVFADDREYIVFDSGTGDIVSMGNYVTIHDELDIPCFIDIESVSNFKLSVMEKNEFFETRKFTGIDTNKQTLLDKELYDAMRQEIYVANLMFYIINASYDCKDAIRQYSNKYSTIDSILDNVCEHIDAFDKEEHDGIVDTGTIDKIMNDAKLLGMDLVENEAVKLLNILISVMGDNARTVLQYHNAIVVFVVEHICLTECDFGK